MEELNHTLHVILELVSVLYLDADETDRPVLADVFDYVWQKKCGVLSRNDKLEVI